MAGLTSVVTQLTFLTDLYGFNCYSVDRRHLNAVDHVYFINIINHFPPPPPPFSLGGAGN